MSLLPQAPKKPGDLAFTLLTFPFETIERVGSRIVAAFIKSKHKPAEMPAEQVSNTLPDVTANLQYTIADRVHSTEVRGRKVSFYQYHQAKVIRISCREIRGLKPLEFTPSIADVASLTYDIDGAIQWVRENGLESKPVEHAIAKAPGKGAKNIADAKPSPPGAEQLVSPSKSIPPSAAAVPLNIVPAAGNKSAPFTGRIVSYGITKRSGGGDKKPYMTYAMKLQSESGAYEKEFIGEHLSDLVTDLALKEGQLVTLQLLGKHHFEVEVAGKMEARSRNHFAITPL